MNLLKTENKPFQENINENTKHEKVAADWQPPFLACCG